MAFAKKFFRVREKTPFGFCDGPQMTVSEFLFGEYPNYPKYHTTYRPVGLIHRVAAEGDAGRMEILIMLGQCSVFDRDHKNRTALHFACVYGRLPVVDVLLKSNCEIDAFDQRQITPLMKSVQCWKQKCAAVLLEHGADPNIRDSSGNCALHYAVYNGHEDMAALLLEYHADIEQKTKDGFTPLLLALREKRVEVAEFLVRKGADIHVVDDMRRNTLMYAIRCGSKDIAMLLLQKGIDFFYKDVFGWTALRYAVEGHCTFRQMLLDFEENIHNNKKDNEPEQMDSGNDSLARISGCSSPGLPLPVLKEDECSCDTKVKCPSAECASLPQQSISESAPLSCAGSLSSAIDKIFENSARRKVAEPDLEVTSEEDHSRFDERGSIHSLSIYENLPNMSGKESVEADSRREKTNEPATESGEEYSPLMVIAFMFSLWIICITLNEMYNYSSIVPSNLFQVINEMNDSVLNKAVEMKEAWSIQEDLSEEPAVKLTSEEESDSYDSFEKNPPLAIFNQIHTQDVAYLSIVKDQRGEKMVMCQEKEFSKECPQSKPTIVEQESVPKEAWDMSPVIQLLADTPKDYPLSETTVEENDSVPNEVCDTKHGKWFLVESPDEYIQVKGIDDLSFSEDERYESIRYDEEQGIFNLRQSASTNHFLFLPRGTPLKNMLNGSPTTAITCLVLKPIQKKTPLPCKAPARKEVKAFVSESDVYSSSEEEQEWPDDNEGEHLKACHQTSCFKPMQDAIENQDLVLMEDSTMKQEKSLTAGAKTAQLRSEEEQTGRCGRGKKQWKPFFEQLQLKWNVRVSVNPEIHVKNAAEERGVTTAQLRPKKEQTGRFGSDKKQRKPIFERLQSKWRAQMSRDPEESRENTGAAEEKGATTVQLRPEEEQTKQNGCDKKQRKPIFERFQPKWSARVSVGPEESRENTGATGEKESPKLFTSEEQTGCHDSEKKPQLHILERFQPKWSVRLRMEAKEGENTEATETMCSSDEYTELKSVQATTEKQDSVPTEDPTTEQEISLMAESDSSAKSEEVQRSNDYENSQSTGIDHLSMIVGQRSKDIVSEEEEEPDLEAASGDEQNKCYSRESNQSLVEKTKMCASNGIDIAKYPCEAAVFTSPAAAAAGGGSGGDTAAAGSGGISATAAGADAAAGGGTDADAGGIADSTMDELVLQRKSGEINDQRFLIKENANHDGPRKKTCKGKHKVTKEVRAMVDVTQASEPVSGDDSGGSLKIQNSPSSYNALLDFNKVHELLRKKNQKIENKIIALQKELTERREEKSKLEDEIVEQDEEFWTLRFTLCKEFKETRIIQKNIKKHLHEKQKQFNERAAMAELERHLRTRDMELRSARAILKELQESQRQHIETLKTAQKMKDHLQRIEQEHSELKVEVKEQAKKIEELRGCLQNSPLKLEQNEKLTQAGTQETLEELCENISLMGQTGIRIQSLRSESSKMKTGKDSNTSAQKSYEQQCIEELRISNALLYNVHPFGLYRNRRLDKSCTRVHITVEQDTSSLHTPETRFSLENPCVASSCPHRHFFPCGNMVLPGNPRFSDDCMRSYPVTMEDEEKSIEVLSKLKQSLEYNLYQQQKKNDELAKEITRNEKLLKMAKIGHEM
ncbi:ankyrin repeat domain-containing protein 36C-like [Chionomys nivalis]|uniref:ankyrin repeat domain-containing protein 36C-like n=1 Tax=Chionomys nivalis TaxID=269649 RepID=UPI00259A6244|nr:ankyrin repeat domain-containing protein 36C-like [Chionomys nivalis]